MGWYKEPNDLTFQFIKSVLVQFSTEKQSYGELKLGLCGG